VVSKPSIRSNSRILQETKLIIGIPVHNSETSIAKTVVALRPLNVDIIVCDDFSTDATEEIARELGCKVIKHPKELGFSDCVTSLFLAARRVHASYLLTVDSGMDFTLRDVLNLLEKVQSGVCDIAIGSDNSRDETYSGEVDEHVRDPYSLFRAYGKRALGLITPTGTTSVVMEYDVLDFARQQGLKVKEYAISSAELSKEKPGILSSKLRSIPNKIEASLNRTLGLMAFKYPLLFLGTPALAMLVATGIQTAETVQFWHTGTQLSTGFYYAGFDLVVSLILGVGALILKSQNNEKTMKRN
jgi:glycosyltransferase involved in cell wall biosynthesis